MRKVNVMVIRPWIAKKVVELVGIDDEVVIEYAMGFLEDKDQPARNLYLENVSQADLPPTLDP